MENAFDVDVLMLITSFQEFECRLCIIIIHHFYLLYNFYYAIVLFYRLSKLNYFVQITLQATPQF